MRFFIFSDLFHIISFLVKNIKNKSYEKQGAYLNEKE